ncbi:alpha/beta hydrolase [Catenulispora subtropica]|uniref:Alpha/beta hydrolase n=1 Tax=Catenulispora subtropica TaxID=450798 RepID=A0ABP5ESI1_9ACTN
MGSVATFVSASGPAAAAPGANPVNPYGGLGRQHPDWQACPGNQDPVTYCADIEVPMDWYDPSKGTISVHITRVPGTGGAARRGILMVDPGGPGSDGSALATTTAKDQPDLLHAYDLIGFAPRGVAPSTKLDCGIDWTRYTPVADERDRSAANTARQLADARLIGQSCGAAPLAPYITSDQTIRDMDLIRAVLGERKLNYLGFSYGTWLGSWYAATFRDRVDRFVLDSNLNWLTTLQEDYVHAWAHGFQRRYDTQFIPWLARHDDRYGFGTTPEAARAALADLRTAVAAQDRGSALDVGQAHALYNSDAWPQWAELLKTLRADPTQAPKLLAPTRVPTGKPDSGAFWAVLCADSPWTHDPASWVAAGDQLGADYPLVGAESTEEPCAFYPFASQHPVHPGGDSLPRLLMVQNQVDPAAPAEGAIADAVDAHEPMVFVRNAGNHIAYDTGNTCVDTHVNDYLVRGRPAASAVCEGLPLPFDDRVYETGL